LIKTKLSFTTALFCALIFASQLSAGTIWDNGIGGNSNFCDSNNACGGNTVFDAFSVASGPSVRIQTIRFTDFFFNAPNPLSTYYTSTTWSIWSGDPLVTGSTALYKGTMAGSFSNIVGNCNGPGGCQATISLDVSSSGVVLSGGQTYYLGLTNTLNASGGPNVVSSRALGLSGLGKLESSDVSFAGNFWADQSIGGCNIRVDPHCSEPANSASTAFAIDTTPEPGTWTLMLISAAGFAVWRRRSKA
jgi:hypothetical protein